MVMTSEPLLFVSPFILMQFEQQRFRQRLSIEHAFLDRRRHRAAIAGHDRHYSVLHFKPARDYRPIRGLETKLFTHRPRTSSSGRLLPRVSMPALRYRRKNTAENLPFHVSAGRFDTVPDAHEERRVVGYRWRLGGRNRYIRFLSDDRLKSYGES
jgi:hypothetical protein